MITRQIPDTVTTMLTALPSVLFVEVAATSKDDLDDTLADLGFSPLSGTQSQTPTQVNMWGCFSTADAPTEGVQAGDMGYCSDGNEGEPCFTVYDGSEWKAVELGNSLDADT